MSEALLRTVRIGFLPLTDCASLVMAAERGFDRKHGIEIVLSREGSWAAVRDKLGAGMLDAAHVLYGLVYGVQLGIGCAQQEMAVLMTLSQNGQAITLARSLAEDGVADGAALARRIRAGGRTWTFAHTFPTGNHAMLLKYWLATLGIDPLREVRLVTVPPAQMVAHLRDGLIDGFCAGEPWGQRAVALGAGVTLATSQQVWPDHPGKVLGTTALYAERNPDVCRALVAAVLEAARWIEAAPEHRRDTAAVLARPEYLGLAEELILPRLLGRYQDGLAHSWDDGHALAFHRGGEVNFPYLSDATWFMSQFKRWGLLRAHPDYRALAGAVNRIDLYQGGAALAGVALPAAAVRTSALLDGVVWDGSDPASYAAGFALRA